MQNSFKKLPDWEDVLSSAARLQTILENMALVGGTATSIYVKHRLSVDADHVSNTLVEHFDAVLSKLESVSGWKTARIKKPVLILGNLDGIETGIRQLIREEPLETTSINTKAGLITLPTPEEMLRIKGILILKRNATRDYLDFSAMYQHIGEIKTIKALEIFDRLYPQKNGSSALMQLAKQLSDPQPYDLQDVDLSNYKQLKDEWHDFNVIRKTCINCSDLIVNELILNRKEDDIKNKNDICFAGEENKKESVEIKNIIRPESNE